MSKELYCFEKGDCRGIEFTNKTTLDKEETLSILKEAVTIKDEDEKDIFVDGLYDSSNHNKSSMLIALIIGSDVVEETVTVEDHIKMIEEGKSFNIELEESTIGIGPSKKDAKLAYIEVNGEDDW